ncbi:Hypothetical predicted protein [Olea europaea subsp. europaea]|uniref:Uncharacterized protein n=1 Tax=Olea europaea subsp. europaea TaxID=158383 RepID=A0A8S0RHI1_OLEEU|nr:Hypothetical predicted protein [Olea europaea subsp. europaea]
MLSHRATKWSPPPPPPTMSPPLDPTPLPTKITTTNNHRFHPNHYYQQPPPTTPPPHTATVRGTTTAEHISKKISMTHCLTTPAATNTACKITASLLNQCVAAIAVMSPATVAVFCDERSERIWRDG